MGTGGANGSNGGLNGKANGVHESEPPSDPSGAVEDLAPEELAPAPAQVAELVAACLRFAASKYGITLDGTPETLSILDQYVRDARAEMLVRPESIELVQSTVGAYLGEVIRQAFGGEWVAEGDPSTWRLCMTHVFLSFNPIGMAREALSCSEEDGWNAHLEMDDEDREGVERRLEALGEMDEGDYFLPSVRFDVVQLTVEALRASMKSRGLADVRFSKEDYE